MDFQSPSPKTARIKGLTEALHQLLLGCVAEVRAALRSNSPVAPMGRINERLMHYFVQSEDPFADASRQNHSALDGY